MSTFGWGAIVTLSIFCLTNLCMAIFHYARITTLLDVVLKGMDKLSAQLEMVHGTYSTKEEVKFAKETMVEKVLVAKEGLDKELRAVWSQIDALKSHPMTCEHFKPKGT